MKISFLKKESLSLGHINVGDCFMYYKDVFLKTINSSDNFSSCVNLSNGVIEELHTDTLVVPLNVELIFSRE